MPNDSVRYLIFLNNQFYFTLYECRVYNEPRVYLSKKISAIKTWGFTTTFDSDNYIISMMSDLEGFISWTPSSIKFKLCRSLKEVEEFINGFNKRNLNTEYKFPSTIEELQKLESNYLARGLPI